MLRVALAAALAALAVPARAVDPRLANAPKAWKLRPVSEERRLILWEDCDTAVLVGRWRGTVRCGSEEPYVFEGFVYQTEAEPDVLQVDSWLGGSWAVRQPVGLRGKLSKGAGGAAFTGTLRIVSPATYDLATRASLTVSSAYGAGTAIKVAAAFPKRAEDSIDATLTVTGKKGRLQANAIFFGTADRCLIIADRLFTRPVRGCASKP